MRGFGSFVVKARPEDGPQPSKNTTIIIPATRCAGLPNSADSLGGAGEEPGRQVPRSVSRSQVLVLAGAGVLTVLLLLASRTPPGKEEAAAQALPDPSGPARAGGRGPGERHSSHAGHHDAARILAGGPRQRGGPLEPGPVLRAKAGSTTRRWNASKAVWNWTRGHSEAWFYLGRTYATMDSTDLAIAAFNEYRSTVTDTAIINRVDRFVMQLNNEKQSTMPCGKKRKRHKMAAHKRRSACGRTPQEEVGGTGFLTARAAPDVRGCGAVPMRSTLWSCPCHPSHLRNR